MNCRTNERRDKYSLQSLSSFRYARKRGSMERFGYLAVRSGSWNHPGSLITLVFNSDLSDVNQNSTLELSARAL